MSVFLGLHPFSKRCQSEYSHNMEKCSKIHLMPYRVRRSMQYGKKSGMIPPPKLSAFEILH